jgi:hypothetical protein
LAQHPWIGRSLAGPPRLPALHPLIARPKWRELRRACFGGFAPRDLSPATPAPGPRFLGRGSERALPGFACPSPASFSRSGHDAARAETPEPPGSGVTTPARRHRTLSRSQGVPLGAPLVEKAGGNIDLPRDIVKRPETACPLYANDGRMWARLECTLSANSGPSCVRIEMKAAAN